MTAGFSSSGLSHLKIYFAIESLINNISCVSRVTGDKSVNDLLIIVIDY